MTRRHLAADTNQVDSANVAAQPIRIAAVDVGILVQVVGVVAAQLDRCHSQPAVGGEAGSTPPSVRALTHSQWTQSADVMCRRSRESFPSQLA